MKEGSGRGRRRWAALIAGFALAIAVAWLQIEEHFVAMKYASLACGLLMGYACFHRESPTP